MSEKRFFVHFADGKRYQGATPISVAKKIAENLFLDTNNKKSLLLSIRECTKDSKKKVYHYKATKTSSGKITVNVNKKIKGGSNTYVMIQKKDSNKFLFVHNKNNLSEKTNTDDNNIDNGFIWILENNMEKFHIKSLLNIQRNVYLSISENKEPSLSDTKYLFNKSELFDNFNIKEIKL